MPSNRTYLMRTVGRRHVRLAELLRLFLAVLKLLIAELRRIRQTDEDSFLPASVSVLQHGQQHETA
jgi:hypothetical protein